jgi:hypothetical protein
MVGHQLARLWGSPPVGSYVTYAVGHQQLARTVVGHQLAEPCGGWLGVLFELLCVCGAVGCVPRLFSSALTHLRSLSGCWRSEVAQPSTGSIPWPAGFSAIGRPHACRSCCLASILFRRRPIAAPPIRVALRFGGSPHPALAGRAFVFSVRLVGKCAAPVGALPTSPPAPRVGTTSLFSCVRGVERTPQSLDLSRRSRWASVSGAGCCRWSSPGRWADC